MLGCVSVDTVDDLDPLQDDATIVFITLQPLSNIILSITPTPTNVKTRVDALGHEIMLGPQEITSISHKA